MAIVDSPMIAVFDAGASGCGYAFKHDGRIQLVNYTEHTIDGDASESRRARVEADLTLFAQQLRQQFTTADGAAVLLVEDEGSLSDLFQTARVFGVLQDAGLRLGGALLLNINLLHHIAELGRSWGLRPDPDYTRRLGEFMESMFAARKVGAGSLTHAPMALISQVYLASGLSYPEDDVPSDPLTPACSAGNALHDPVHERLWTMPAEEREYLIAEAEEWLRSCVSDFSGSAEERLETVKYTQGFIRLIKETGRMASRRSRRD